MSVAKEFVAIGIGLSVVVALSATTLLTLGNAPVAEFHEPERAHTDLEWSMEVCLYGSEMFYVARDVPDARELAISDCSTYLADNGEEWFLDFYGINGPAGLKSGVSLEP